MEYRTDYAAIVAWLTARMDTKNARFWLIRACLLSPKNPRFELELAQNRLADGDLELAAKAFTNVANRYDSINAHIGLALASAGLGDVKRATAALEAVLTKHCLPESQEFALFAARLAGEAGYGGYQGVTVDGQVIRTGYGPRLGGKANMPALMRVEGLVGWDGDGLSGWAVRVAAPDTPPELWLSDINDSRLRIAFDKMLLPDDKSPINPRYLFQVSRHELSKLTPPFSLRGAEGPDIFGSPLTPIMIPEPHVPAAYRGEPKRITPLPRKLAVIMPVYSGLSQTKAAIDSIVKALPIFTRLIVVDDCTPDTKLARHLDKLADVGQITLMRHRQNQGFCAAVNTGLKAVERRDVLLVNADILLPQGAIETLREVAYSHPDIGTTTPISNEASLLSYPSMTGGNMMPDKSEVARLNMLARMANGASFVEIPTAVGFCMFIRHDCLAVTGGFRGEIFAQGYAEENDFCIRARHLGFRHVAAPGAFVAHEGSVSFSTTGRSLLERNLAYLEQIFPGYHKLVEKFVRADPLKAYRAALDEARLRSNVGRGETVLLISDPEGDDGGLQVEFELEEWRKQGKYPLLLKPQRSNKASKAVYTGLSVLVGDISTDFGNLTFCLPTDSSRLIDLLLALRVSRVILQHSLGQHKSVRELAAALRVPQDLAVYDYGSVCPRQNLLNRPEKTGSLRYCGEPVLKSCVECCRSKDTDVRDRISVSRLRNRSAAEFSNSDRIFVPSLDAAHRLRRYFPGIVPHLRPLRNDNFLPSLRSQRVDAKASRVRVAVIRYCSQTKGFDLLLSCAIDAKERGLPLDFFVIGGSADDDTLLDAGVFVTGLCEPGRAQSLIAELNPDIAFVPSRWPEPWCFALDEAWNAGLKAVVFNLGAQGERMRATRRGVALPLGLPCRQINNILIEAGHGNWPEIS